MAFHFFFSYMSHQYVENVLMAPGRLLGLFRIQKMFSRLSVTKTYSEKGKAITQDASKSSQKSENAFL